MHSYTCRCKTVTIWYSTMPKVQGTKCRTQMVVNTIYHPLIRSCFGNIYFLLELGLLLKCMVTVTMSCRIEYSIKIGIVTER